MTPQTPPQESRTAEEIANSLYFAGHPNEIVMGAIEIDEYAYRQVQSVYKPLIDIAPIEKWIEMYQHYQEILTNESSVEFWEEQYRLANQERKELKAALADRWVSVEQGLPKTMDEDYLVAVRNKNKEGGIFIQDIANFTSDGVWVKSNTWENVTHWSELPAPPLEQGEKKV